jgi:hypothetical protein
MQSRSGSRCSRSSICTHMSAAQTSTTYLSLLPGSAADDGAQAHAQEKGRFFLTVSRTPTRTLNIGQVGHISGSPWASLPAVSKPTRGGAPT